MASREDSYWARFTKSGGRERDDAQDPAAPVDAAPDLPSALGSQPGSGMPRPPVQDVNVTLTRPPPPPPAPPPLAATPGAATEQIETVIGRESAVQGTIRSEHSIRIQGGAQGEIECKRSVFVEEGARVSAKITASEVTISGELDGQVFSSGRVEIKPTGRVSGEVNAPSLVMLEGAFFDGQLRMKNRGQPEDATTPDRDEAPAPPPGRRGSGGPPGAAAARNAFES
jgi:cytoskeletal protein CcmA (bactofilin family)